MRKLLSLDLGLTTGYAVIWSDGTIQESGNFTADFILSGDFKEWATMPEAMPSRSVGERPLIFRGKLGNDLERIVKAVEQVLTRQIDFVTPAEWKQTPWKKHPLPRGLSTHERDAIRLGLWYLNDRLKGL